ncbi:MAG TPA: response regulator [Terracidiphilus sp.]
MMCLKHGHRSQARVLVADGDRNQALSLASIMHRAGFNTAIAFNGKEAVDKAKTFRPDLLVTEAYLGRLSGIHAARCITARLPNCKVLFLSSEASGGDIARGAPDGLIYSYTPKPIHPLNLLNAIAYLLSAEWSTVDSPTNHLNPKPGAAETAGATVRTAEAARKQVADAMPCGNSRVAVSISVGEMSPLRMLAST